MVCKNEGCNGHCRNGQYYCYDCYMAWLNGGEDAVKARLKTLVEDKAELVKLRAFKEQVEIAVLGPAEFNGKPIFRDYSTKALFEAIHAGREVVVTADKVARAVGVELPTRGLLARRAAVVQWLKGVDRGATIRELSEELDRKRAVLQETQAALRTACDERDRMRGIVCPCRKSTVCQQGPAVQTFRLKVPDSKANQLNRIESLTKQAATRSAAPAFWLGVGVSGTILGLCHLLWS